MRKRVLVFGLAVLVALVMSVPAAFGAPNDSSSCTGQILNAKAGEGPGAVGTTVSGLQSDPDLRNVDLTTGDAFVGYFGNTIVYNDAQAHGGLADCDGDAPGPTRPLPNR